MTGQAQQFATAKFGAHEAMEVHEVLSGIIDGINNFELFRDHVRDQQLRTILDHQLQFMTEEYNTLLQAVQQHGMSEAAPYRWPKNVSPKYGLRQPAPVSPNASPNEMDDRDVASLMLGQHKSGAIKKIHAALECANPQLRNIIQQSAINCTEQAFEVWNFMNQRGMYQVPTMMDMTTNTLVNAYSAANTVGQGQGAPTWPQ